MLALLVLFVTVAVGMGLAVREVRLRRTPEELRGDWWERFGRAAYPDAKSLLLLCDGGGSNPADTERAEQQLFRSDLQHLVNRLGIEIRMAHYPPYASKYNPIEHRLFPHLSRACRGVVLSSVELVQQLMSPAGTRTGLRVVVDILRTEYATGRKVAEEVKENLTLHRDDFLPLLNYRIMPAA